MGKVGNDFLKRVVYNQLGCSRDEVLAGPGFGLDNSVIRLGNGKVMVSTTDPLSFIPSIGPSDSAWLSAHLIASDIATSGLSPQYGIFDFNLPPFMSNSLFAKYWKSFHRTCQELGVSIIGGHTGRYQGCGYSIIGGGVMMATGTRNSYVTPAMGVIGDDLILTKGIAIETTAILTRAFPRRVRLALGSKLFSRAWKSIHQVTVVQDALLASSVGIRDKGVTAMHDATEGGVVAALLELARASRAGLRLDIDAMVPSEEAGLVCKLFQLAPLKSLSEGSLVVSVRPLATKRVLDALSVGGVNARVVGSLVDRKRGDKASGRKGTTRLEYPAKDPYWEAFQKAQAKGWN